MVRDRRIKAVNEGPEGEAKFNIENEAASFKYRCPRVVLIVKRAQWETGRTRFLINSAVVTMGVRIRGVLKGINLARKWVGAYTREDAIAPNQIGKHNVILKTGDTVIGKVYGSCPIILVERVNVILEAKISLMPFI